MVSVKRVDGIVGVVTQKNGFLSQGLFGRRLRCMPIITFIHPDGRIEKIEALSGDTVLKIALDHSIPMEHACGGNGFCTTCMCDVTEGMAHTSPRNDREENMGVMDDPKRLGCQTQVMGDVTVKMLDS